jgi:hypothetical protein
VKEEKNIHPFFVEQIMQCLFWGVFGENHAEEAVNFLTRLCGFAGQPNFI